MESLLEGVVASNYMIYDVGTAYAELGFIDALVQGGSDCFENAVITLISSGIVRSTDNLYNLMIKKLNTSPAFVTKRLLLYGIKKDVINSFKAGITSTAVKEIIDNAIIEYEEENK